MNLIEPSAVLLETGDPCVFTPAGGPPLPETIGILEDALSERATGGYERVAHKWELTCQTLAVEEIKEGDRVQVNGKTFEILDSIASDPTITVFLITDDI